MFERASIYLHIGYQIFKKRTLSQLQVLQIATGKERERERERVVPIILSDDSLSRDAMRPITTKNWVQVDISMRFMSMPATEQRPDDIDH